MSDLVLRRARDDELDAIVQLAGAALGWDRGVDNLALFTWKHLENPFGPSGIWVAEEGSRLLGVRAFLRWRFLSPSGDRVEAVRAVDTATHPEATGRGIFTRLTLHAVDELIAEGVGFVFNTPNERSRPGYLKMGWEIGGRPAITFSPRPAGLVRLPAARKPADRPGLPSHGGLPAGELLGQLGASVHEQGRGVPGFTTDRSGEFLAWRYGFAPLGYRAVTLGRDPLEGLAVFRRRRRGRAVEVTICELLVPPDDRARRELVRKVRREAPGDFLLRTRGAQDLREGFVPLPGGGPLVTLRPLSGPPPPFGEISWSLGDLELL